MVSYGPDIQNQNFTHMYEFVDYRLPKGKRLEPCIVKGSIYDYINSQPNMKGIKLIIDKAKYTGLLSDCEANFTLFIPTDEYLKRVPSSFFDDMDDGLAREILLSSMMWRKIDKKLITSSPVAYYITKNPRMRMYVTNINNKTVVNNCGSIVKYDIDCNNGMIHILDTLIIPNNDTFMN